MLERITLTSLSWVDLAVRGDQNGSPHAGEERRRRRKWTSHRHPCVARTRSNAMDLVIVRPKQRVVNPPAGDPDSEPRSLAPSRRETHASVVHALTWREREILELLDARMSNKEIARLLQISYEMVNN